LLAGSKHLRKSTGKQIRHIPMTSTAAFDNDAFTVLIKAVIEIAENESKSLN
tara:strand:+ start:242 stop:397 length:156 start_codon:yes stop_codon:yes gene_type:complete